MAQETYIPRKGKDIDAANITASGTLAVTGAATFASTAAFTGAVTAASVTGPVPLVTQAAGNFNLSAATHANKITLVNDADVVITLPAASGTGNVYKIVVVTTAWTTGNVTGLANSATFVGGVVAIDTDSGADSRAWGAATGNNKFTGGTATGGAVGDWISFTDIATNTYLVDGVIKQSGGSEATPFSTAT